MEELPQLRLEVIEVSREFAAEGNLQRLATTAASWADSARNLKDHATVLEELCTLRAERFERLDNSLRTTENRLRAHGLSAAEIRL